MEVGGQTIHDGLTPAFPLLPLDDLPADVPIEPDQLPAGSRRRPDLRSSDAILEVFQKFGLNAEIEEEIVQFENHTSGDWSILRTVL